MVLLGVLLYTHALMFVCPCCGSIGNLALYAFTNISLDMLCPLEILFICIHLCSFGHAVAVLELLLYTNALMFIWSCFSPGFGSIGRVA